MEDCRHCFFSGELQLPNLKVLTYDDMSLLSTPEIACQAPLTCMLLLSVCVLSGDGNWQARDVDVEEKGC